jgi:hypothetical protein
MSTDTANTTAPKAIMTTMTQSRAPFMARSIERRRGARGLSRPPAAGLGGPRSEGARIDIPQTLLQRANFCVLLSDSPVAGGVGGVEERGGELDPYRFSCSIAARISGTISGQDRRATARSRSAISRVHLTTNGSGLNNLAPKPVPRPSAADSSDPTVTAAFSTRVGLRRG